MKLVIVIVHDEDSHELMKTLVENSIGVTKLSSSGGFLKAGNTTLLIGAQEDKLEIILDIVKKKCKTRKELVNTAPVFTENIFIPMPTEIVHGGATVFVVDVDNFYKF
jgi:uncharacterized protein YaaQ